MQMHTMTKTASAFLFAISACTQIMAATPCESLLALKLPNTTITFAQIVAVGGFTPPSPFPSPGPRGGMTIVAAKDLPAFCRVAAVTRPSTDSEIKFEVWMPASNWNGKSIGVGNGGMAGSISYAAMTAPLSRGYATSSTDTGHEGKNNDGSYALGHREKVIDFGYRAVHEMTVKAKLIIAAYYGRGPTLSYWIGCSTGGRQALTEAQRFPADYNGIIAGAPANFLTHLQAFRAVAAERPQLYEPLLWAIKTSSHCPLHLRQLHNICPCCGRTTRTLASFTPMDTSVEAG